MTFYQTKLLCVEQMPINEVSGLEVLMSGVPTPLTEAYCALRYTEERRYSRETSCQSVCSQVTRAPECRGQGVSVGSKLVVAPLAVCTLE